LGAEIPLRLGVFRAGLHPYPGLERKADKRGEDILLLLRRDEESHHVHGSRDILQRAHTGHTMDVASCVGGIHGKEGKAFSLQVFHDTVHGAFGLRRRTDHGDPRGNTDETPNDFLSGHVAPPQGFF
jgi:hypothetical protein